MIALLPQDPATHRLSIAVFAVVYLGMLFGRLPRFAVDRTGVVLLGAIALVAGGVLSLGEAAASVDGPTLAVLFGFMVLSAQLRLSGFYTYVVASVIRLGERPGTLLAIVTAVSGGLSAVFTNDIVCLAVTPVLIRGCRGRSLDPVPFLLALACAANVGSAATLIGNPQNILIGEQSGLSFSGYLAAALPIVLLGLGATWFIIHHQYRGRWTSAPEPAAASFAHEVQLPYDAWQTGKGLVLVSVLFAAFLFTGVPREHAALAAAGVILLNTRMHSRRMLGQVDWQLLVLFAGLFVVNRAFEATGLAPRAIDSLAAHGFDPREPEWLFLIAALLSNAVSNVPAVMLLLSLVSGPQAGLVLALSSTLAGNLLISGSVANVIVVESAAGFGIDIGWRRHARTGIPVTLVTLAIAAALLALRGALD
jgi:Na+/H+ antiporter NhaD/arsenite permease-like protein